ncbi:MAG: hypothetical protein QOH68_2380, partial [Nocardioidaceae bacterium]|nr:hypothetical protein [Nocardioidaceae bacterium]
MQLQDGVISRRQARAGGLTDADIRRLLRRREWARIHQAVFASHTGPTTWQQRAWAAVLVAHPAVLFGESALRAFDGPGRRGHDDTGDIHVGIDRDRQCRVPDGVVVHQIADFDAKSQWNLSPPRVKIEEAVLDVAAQARDDFGTVSVLAAAVQSRRTTASRILRALERRSRLPRRRLLREVLEDIEAGACSALEHAYLRRVERAHGLPSGLRQVRASSRGPIYRDVVYDALGLAVELDGRVDHTESIDRDHDLERDLDAALDELTTLRIGWGQVVGRPCSTAAKLATLMTRRGWTGRLHPCPRCHGGDFQSSGDWKSPLSA